MRLEPAVELDLPEIATWVAADPWHQNLGGNYWLTGSDCIFACKLLDDEGTVVYVRVEDDTFGEANGFRLQTQFAPEHVVSKHRVVRMALQFFQTLTQLARANGKQYIITESESPKLIAFLHRLGWKDAEQANNFVLGVHYEQT